MHPAPDHSDEQLVSLLQQGAGPAFAEIYDRYWKPLYTSAHNVLQDSQAAQDVVQEVFTSLWARRNQVTIESLRAYLFQSVRFQVFKALRAEKTDADFYKRLNLVSQEMLIHDPMVFKELQHVLLQVIDNLPEDQREIFTMNRVQGLTYTQIAERKEISVKTVEKKISLALKQLRAAASKALMLL